MNKLLPIAIICILFGAAFATAMPEQADAKKTIEKITFIHYKGQAKPQGPAGSKPVNCYGFLASGAKWKTAEPFLINPTNADGLSQTLVESAINSSVAEWEKFAGNIFGNGSIDYNAAYITGRADGKNTASFGTYPNNGVIAVTSVWGYFNTTPKNRQLIEWDMLFNDAYFAFGDATIDPSAMDLQNIATHEMGHSAGLNDQYSTACYKETMYGYSTEGETTKRDLYNGDIAGIKKLYG